jgi:uncharacterized protein
VNDPAPPPREPFRIALGVERIGLVPLARPRLAALVVAIVSVFAALGLPRLKVDDSLSQLFRSGSAEFKQYEQLSKRFPSNEFDVLVVVGGKNLLERRSLEQLRELVTELQLIESARGIISLFSARQPPEGGELPVPLIPQDLPEGAEYDRLVERVKSNEILRGSPADVMLLQ